MESNNMLARLLFSMRTGNYEDEMLQKMDISTCFPDDVKMPEAGYNCLHVCAMKGDVKLMEKLLDEGADMLHQGTYSGYTPLHVFIKRKSFYQDKKEAFSMIGKLGNHPIANRLLSEQVKRNCAINPKCHDGMSHLHIACMVDHGQAIEFFLKAGEPVNQAIGPKDYMFSGWTPLHFAVKHSSIAAAKFLFRHEADIHYKNGIGISPIHKLVKRLVDAMNYITMGKRASITPIANEVRTLEMIVWLAFTTNESEQMNFVDDTGLSAFHVACAMSNSALVRKLLKDDVDDINKPLNSNSKYWPGWTALHFAACCCVETVKLLVQNGADITIANTRGETPLDLCMRRYSPEIVHSILSMEEEFRKIKLSDRSTKLLDLILVMNNCDEFHKFVQNLPDVNVTVPHDSPIWPGLSITHLAVSMHERTENPMEYIEKLINPQMIPEKYTCDEGEEKIYWKRIVVCLACKCSLATKNAEGLTPVHLAFKLCKSNVVDKLLNCCKTNEIDPIELSFLHMACAVGNRKVVERFIDEINVPVKSIFKWCREGFWLTVRSNSTSLHIAVIFNHRDIVEYVLQKKAADVYARDSLGFTPVHLSIFSQPITCLFFDNIPDLQECVSNDGLSHLHVAAFVDNDTAIERLLQRNGANVNATFHVKLIFDKIYYFLRPCVNRTPLHVAVKMKCFRAIRTLVEADANIHAESSFSYDTPLCGIMHNVLDDVLAIFLKKLRRDKRVNEAIDPCGVTLLHFACASFDLKWAKRLLDKGANPNAQICQDDHCEIDWKGYTPLHVLIDRAKNVMDKLRNLVGMVRLLLRYDADVTLQNRWEYTPVLLAAKIAQEDGEHVSDDEDSEPSAEGKTSMFSIADLMLKNQKSYDVDPATHQGFSHFHYACKRNKVEIVKKFLENGADINRATSVQSWIPEAGYTPLHFAFAYWSTEVIELLIDKNADVTAKDLQGNTPLHVATKSNSFTIDQLQMMLKMGADIKAQNFYGSTPLDFLIQSPSIAYDKLKFFFDHGCTIKMTEEDSDKGSIGVLLINGMPTDLANILELLVRSCSVKKQIENGFNAIQSLVSVSLHDTRFPECARWTTDIYIETIQMFLDLDYQIDQQNSRGITALHAAIIYYNTQAVEALLVLGADVNVLQNFNDIPLSEDILAINNPESIRMVRIIASHVWKMKLIGLEVQKLVGKSICQENFLDYRLKPRCEDELKRIERTEFVENWTMNDFLRDPKVALEYQTMSSVQREKIDEMFNAPANLRKRFPEFCGLLMIRYRQARSYFKLHSSKENADAVKTKTA